jgi:hypothetical protein
MFVGVLIIQHPQFDQHLINCRADLISCCGWTYVGVHADMRKAMPRDTEKKSVIPLKRAVTPDELEYD